MNYWIATAATNLLINAFVEWYRCWNAFRVQLKGRRGEDERNKHTGSSTLAHRSSGGETPGVPANDALGYQAACVTNPAGFRFRSASTQGSRLRMN